MNDITKSNVFDLVGVTEEELNERYNQLVEATEWWKTFKEKYLETVLEHGMMPGDYPVTLKTKYVDFQVIYPEQKTTKIIDNDRMKMTTVKIEEVDAESGEVTEKKVNAYEYFKTKTKAAPKPYVKEIKND